MTRFGDFSCIYKKKTNCADFKVEWFLSCYCRHELILWIRLEHQYDNLKLLLHNRRFSDLYVLKNMYEFQLDYVTLEGKSVKQQFTYICRLLTFTHLQNTSRLDFLQKKKKRRRKNPKHLPILSDNVCPLTRLSVPSCPFLIRFVLVLGAVRLCLSDAEKNMLMPPLNMALVT